jgi:hypothetical protein
VEGAQLRPDEWKGEVTAGVRGQYFEGAASPKYSAILWPNNRQGADENIYSHGVLRARGYGSKDQETQKGKGVYARREDMEGNRTDH